MTMASNKKDGAKTTAFNGISVANSMFACLPCDDEAEIKKKNRGAKKREQEKVRQQAHLQVCGSQLIGHLDNGAQSWGFIWALFGLNLATPAADSDSS